MRKNSFTLDDFIRQLDELRKLGPMSQIIGMIPGTKEMLAAKKSIAAEVESEMNRMQGIYNSMTKEERHDAEVLDDQRRHRIARGAGVKLSEVGKFVKQFKNTSEMMRHL